MTLYKYWIDFVTYPLDPEKVRSENQRLDVSNAFHPNSEEYKLAQGQAKGALITQDFIFFGGKDADDEFEMMNIGTTGEVFIWTQKYVWFLMRDRGLEKLMCVPRHPNYE